MICFADQREGFPNAAKHAFEGKGGSGGKGSFPFPPSYADLEEIVRNCSYPTFANHLLKGSAFCDGMDWMIRSMVSVLAVSVSYFFPSADSNFSCTVFGYNSINPSLSESCILMENSLSPV